MVVRHLSYVRTIKCPPMMRVDEYAALDGTALAALIAAGDVTAAEVASVALEAHALTHPQLNAVIETYPDALDPRPRPQGAFGGVPFAIKDVGPDFAGRLCENGSRLCEGYIGTADSAYAQMIKGAGFTLIGRTNTPEFSMANCAMNRLHGTTANPWGPDRSTSGSSGGAAAAVAAGVVPIAHSSDIGGSTRGPAAWCGTVGLQPSRGRVSSGPAESETGYGMCQSFVVTRSVRDTAAALDLLSVPQPGDPYVIRRPPEPFSAYVAGGHRPVRIAFSTDPLTDASVDPEIAQAIRDVASALEGLGHRVTEAAPAIDVQLMDRICLDIWYYGWNTWLDSFARELGREVGPDTVERATLRFYEFARTRDPAKVLEALDEMNTVRRSVGAFFADHDIWLSPTFPEIAARQGVYSMDLDLTTEEFMAHEMRVCPFLILYNLTGQPAISLPLAQHSSGLPIGLQFGARPGEEHLLIGLAAELEQARPWAERIPQLHVSRCH